MIVTVTDARSAIEDVLSMYCEDRLAALELQIRADLAATGPPAPHNDDGPPVLDGDWTRVSVEEVLVRARAHFDAWRETLLATFDHH